MTGFIALSIALCRLAFCTCIAGGTISDAIRSTVAVMEAVPVTVRDTAVSDGASSRTWRQRIYTMAVHRRWKGVPADTVQIITGTGGGDCGYPLEIRGYHIWSLQTKERHTWVPSICSRTKPAREAAEELRVLGRPR